MPILNRRYWLLLEKSDETRISKGIEGYKDKTGEVYHYDSLVPNHKQLGKGDLVVLRKEDEILGIGAVDGIAIEPDAKLHRRCPTCGSTAIRERTTKTPRWKCGRCAHEFFAPRESIVDVQSYHAEIVDFSRLDSPPSVADVKSCALNGDGISSQLSILELHPEPLSELLEGRTIDPLVHAHPRATKGQGFGLSPDQRKSVEQRAMYLARELYERGGWEVVDTSSSRPYDLFATQDNRSRFIEVKGTTGPGQSIVLTDGEIRHAKKNRRLSALVIVSDIQLEQSDGRWIAAGGNISTHEDPWEIEESRLQATQYRYRIDVGK